MKSGFHTIKIALAPLREQPPVQNSNPFNFNLHGSQPVSPTLPSPSEILQPNPEPPPLHEFKIPEATSAPDGTEILVDPTAPHVTIPQGFLNEHVHNIKDIAENDGGVINSIFAPVGQAMLDGFHWLFIKTLEVSPLALTTVGLCCFILTMAWGNGKPYVWGMMAWALGAIIRVISHEFN